MPSPVATSGWWSRDRFGRAAGGQQHGFGAEFMEGAIEFINEAQPDHCAGFNDEFGGEGVRA